MGKARTDTTEGVAAGTELTPVSATPATLDVAGGPVLKRYRALRAVRLGEKTLEAGAELELDAFGAEPLLAAAVVALV